MRFGVCVALVSLVTIVACATAVAPTAMAAMNYAGAGPPPQAGALIKVVLAG